MARYPSVFSGGADSDAMVFWNATSRKSQGTITMSGVANADETFVIDTQTFTWKVARSIAGEVTIGATAAEAVTNIVIAIAADLTTVTAIDGAGDTVVVSATNPGTPGNSIIFTEASTNMAADGSGTLGGTTAGVDSGFFFQELPTGIYFDNIRLDNPEPFWEDRSPIIKAAELLSGGVSVQASPPDFARPIRVAFRCHTEIHHHITILRTKMGAPYTLLIDEYTYPNCYISSFREHEWFQNKFEYEISFVQATPP